jgi:hypothetical protein
VVASLGDRSLSGWASITLEEYGVALTTGEPDKQDTECWQIGAVITVIELALRAKRIMLNSGRER